mgnify:CR=1 FL=1
MQKMQLDIPSLFSVIQDSDYSRMFFVDDWADKKHFVKQFLSGVFINDLWNNIIAE